MAKGRTNGREEVAAKGKGQKEQARVRSEGRGMTTGSGLASCNPRSRYLARCGRREA